MAKLSLKAGTTSKSVGIFIPDSSSTTGAGLTGLAYNTASLQAYWYQPGVTGATAISLATLASATAAWSSGGFKEIDSTNMPGHYRLDVPNAVLTGATSAILMLRGAANMAPVQLEFELTAWDNQNAAPDVNVASFSASAITSGAFASGAIHATAIASDALRNDAIADGAITAAKLAADCITAAKVAADVTTEIQNGLATAANLAAVKTIADKLDSAMELDVSVYRFTTNALEQAPSGGGGGGTDWTADEKTAIKTILGIPASGTTPDAPSAGALKVIDDFLDTEVAAIKAKTDNLPASPAATGDIPTALQNADALLNRDMSAVSDTNSRSPLNALRALRNKFTTATGTYTVFKEDDSTSAWTATLGTDAAALPIISSDPA